MNILIVGNIIKDIYLDFEANLFETDRNQQKVLETTLDEESLFYKNHMTVRSGASIAEEVFWNFRIQTEFAGDVADTRYIIKSGGSVKYLTSKYAKPSVFLKPETTPDWLFIDRSARLNTSNLKQILAWLKMNPSVKVAIFTGVKFEKLLARRDDFSAHQLLGELVQRANILFFSGQTLDELKTPEETRPELVVRATPELIESEVVNPLDENSLRFGKNKSQVMRLEINQKHFFTHLSIYSGAVATILAALSTGWNLERAMRFAKLNLQYASLGKTLNLDQLYKKLQSSLRKEDELTLLAKSLSADGRGILAIDESRKTMRKKLLKLGLPDSTATSEKYR